MPQKQQTDTLSLPMLLQLAGIGGQPQQDSTREALSYMVGQQRLAADEADRKVRQSQAEQEFQLRMEALKQQTGQRDQGARLHSIGSWVSSAVTPADRAAALLALRNELGIVDQVAGKTPEQIKGDGYADALDDKNKPAPTGGPTIVDRIKANPGKVIGEGVRAIPSVVGTGYNNLKGNWHQFVNTVFGIPDEVPIYNQQMKLQPTPGLLEYIQQTYPQPTEDYATATARSLEAPIPKKVRPPLAPAQEIESLKAARAYLESLKPNPQNQNFTRRGY